MGDVLIVAVKVIPLPTNSTTHFHQHNPSKSWKLLGQSEGLKLLVTPGIVGVVIVAIDTSMTSGIFHHFTCKVLDTPGPIRGLETPGHSWYSRCCYYGY